MKLSVSIKRSGTWAFLTEIAVFRLSTSRSASLTCLLRLEILGTAHLIGKQSFMTSQSHIELSQTDNLMLLPTHRSFHENANIGQVGGDTSKRRLEFRLCLRASNILLAQLREAVLLLLVELGEAILQVPLSPSQFRGHETSFWRNVNVRRSEDWKQLELWHMTNWLENMDYMESCLWQYT